MFEGIAFDPDNYIITRILIFIVIFMVPPIIFGTTCKKVPFFNFLLTLVIFGSMAAAGYVTFFLMA